MSNGQQTPGGPGGIPGGQTGGQGGGGMSGGGGTPGGGGGGMPGGGGSSGGQTFEVQVTFTVEGLDDDSELHVLEFHGSEALSQQFSFSLDLACRQSNLDFSQIIGQSGLLTITRAGQSRYVHGIVSQFQQQQRGSQYTLYDAVLVPRAWRLQNRTDCRIFQNESIRQVISSVLSDHSVENRFRCRGNQDPPRREYCVQYRESDWNYISRLLEEEGFFYFFEHTESNHTLVISNDQQVHSEIPGETTVRFGNPDQSSRSRERITDMSYAEQMISGRVAMQDYNFQMPSVDFSTDDEGERDTDLEVYDYPGVYDAPEKGTDLSSVRRERLEVMRRGGSGSSDCMRFIPGYTFTLDNHHNSDLNEQQYLVTNVQHSGATEADLDEGRVSDRCVYSNSFSYISAQTPYRPPRRTRQPRVMGSQTAVVVGPAGEEIHTNEHGQVKVQFHWDRLHQRDEQSSCWVRVAMPWAGQGFGAMFIPRIGHEVVVDFLEGDPDRPIVTGSVYHAQNVPPLNLPDEKTRSTIKSNSSPGGGGYNELRFEDKAGEEEVYTHAQKDQNEVVENCMTTRVGVDQAINIGNDRTRDVGEDETITIGNDRVETVGNDDTITVDNDRRLRVKGNQTIQVDKDQDETVRQDSNETVGQDKSTHVRGDYELKVYTDRKTTVASNHDEKVTGFKKVKVGDKLELRCGPCLVRLESNGKATVQATDIRMEATSKVDVRANTSIMLRVGTSTIALTPAQIEVLASLVKINC